MVVARASEETGVTIPAPVRRSIKCLLAPDKGNVHEMSLNVVVIEPNSGTDYHTHDRPEMIYVVSGTGTGLCDGATVALGPDTALWVLAGEKHQVTNTAGQPMKLVTVFVPPFTTERTYAQCLERAQALQETGVG
jgi:quercetin dioxygenase-like cupin family protein